METYIKKRKLKFFAIVLTMLMAIVFIPTNSNAAVTAQKDFSNGFWDNEGYHSELTEDDHPDYDKLGHGTAYISLSMDGEYVDSPMTGEKMAYVPINIEDVADEIKLEDFEYYDFIHPYPGDDESEMTSLLHLYLYLMNHYYGENSASDIYITGSADSLYMQNGFWGHDENLTYYVNGAYPLYYEGWGATCDGIFLEDGDFIDVQMYTDWSFWSDSNAGYHYFIDNESNITHAYSTSVNSPLKVRLGRAWGSLDIGGATEITVEDTYTISYGKTPFSDDCKEVTIENGVCELTFEEPGKYYVWASGGTGDSGSVVSSPAYATIQVKGTEHNFDSKFTVDKKASFKEDGSKSKHCLDENCRATADQTAIPAVAAPILEEGIFAYSGEEIKPELTLKDREGNVLSSESDYDYAYADNVNAGTAHVTVTLKGSDYEGEAIVDFEIQKSSAAEVGNTEVRVRVKKTAQADLKTYGTVTYKIANTKVATVTAKGVVKGKKSGTTKLTVKYSGDTNHNGQTITFKVTVPKEITKAELKKTSFTYNGKAQKPGIKSVNGSKKLKAGSAYEVTWPENPVLPGKYKVIIKGTGSYDGSVTKTYSIAKAKQKVSASSPKVHVGAKAKIKASSKSNGGFTYKSLNKKVATVDTQGNVKGIKKGTVKIKVTAKADKCYKAASKTIKVKVIK